jgi:hypothetical protein
LPEQHVAQKALLVAAIQIPARREQP